MRHHLIICMCESILHKQCIPIKFYYIMSLIYIQCQCTQLLHMDQCVASSIYQVMCNSFTPTVYINKLLYYDTSIKPIVFLALSCLIRTPWVCKNHNVIFINIRTEPKISQNRKRKTMPLPAWEAWFDRVEQ